VGEDGRVERGGDGNAAHGFHVLVDGGVDDALALAVLVGARVPIAQIVATEGSRPLEQTALTTARLAASLNSDAPVRLGTATARGGPYPPGRDPFHGDDCFAGRSDVLGRADAPTEPWTALDGPVLATGALTVVAAALDAGDSITSVTWMGGSVGVGGNMTAAAEFNAWMDPGATDRVMSAGCPVKMVPLDVTLQCSWGAQEVLALKGVSGGGAMLAAAVEPLLLRDRIFVPHDAVAAVAVLEPSLFEWVARDVRCETTGVLTRGATVVDRRPWTAGGQTLVAEAVHSEKVNELILEALAALPR